MSPSRPLIQVDASELDCVVCLGEKRLHLLPCSHICCQECITYLVRPNKQFKCPYCRRDVVVPPGGFPVCLLSEYLREKVNIASAKGGTLENADKIDDTKNISTILSSLSPHQRLEVLSEGDIVNRTPLHCAALFGHSDSVKMIRSQLTSKQQLTLLSMRDRYSRTPADCVSETERLLGAYEQRAEQRIGCLTTTTSALLILIMSHGKAGKLLQRRKFKRRTLYFKNFGKRPLKQRRKSKKSTWLISQDPTRHQDLVDDYGHSIASHHTSLSQSLMFAGFSHDTVQTALKLYARFTRKHDDSTISEIADQLINAYSSEGESIPLSHYGIHGHTQLNNKEKLQWIRSLSRRHASGVRALGQLALNSYLAQQSYYKHKLSNIYSDNNTEKSADYSGSDNPIHGNSNPGQQAQTEKPNTDDAQRKTGGQSTYRQSTEQNERNKTPNTPNNIAITIPDFRHVSAQDIQRQAQGDDEAADIKLSKPAQIFSPTDDAEDNQITEQHVHQPSDDQYYILVKEPNYKGQGSESAGSIEISDAASKHSTEVSEDTCYEAQEHTLPEVVPPCSDEYDVTIIEELMPLSVTMKKSDDDTDPYRRAIRDLVTVPHDFAPERVVTPVYTVPRYPDNHNPLLPLALQKRLDEMSPREFLTYVLNELTLEERESLMVDERQRRKTFLVNWPYENQLNGIKMAQAGFYSVDDYDRVQCVFCRGSLHRWEQDDVPMLEHARSFAFCRFVKGLNCGNREYRSHKLTKEDMKNINLYKQPDMTPNRDGSLETDSSALGISTNRAAMVEYAPDASRLKTYNRWPASSPLAAADLCAAGFYFTGFDDQVRCFYCAGGIREWSTTDDPWEEHARWFPECEYVLQKKGEVFVNDVHARTPANKKTTRSTKAQKKEMKEKEEEQTTVEAMFEECRKFGHEDAVIIAAMKRRGPNLKKISDLIEVIYALEEKGLPLEHFDSDSTPSITTDSGYLAVPEEDRGRAMDVEMDGLSLPPPGVMDNHSQGQQAPDGACKYCYKKTRAITDATYIGLPCGHVIYCERCNRDENMKLRADPTYKPRCQFNKCGAPLTGTFKIFYA